MAERREGRRATAIAAIAPVATALAALVPALLLYGFTVDDALIPARYATHLANGLGYRWNATGSVTDGVTPLGFPYLLTPFAKSGPLSALAAAKALGLIAWTSAAAVLGAAIARSSDKRLRFTSILLLACSAPLAAWSVAGLETGFAMAFGALAVALPELGFGKLGAMSGGLLAALRPDALPFAIVTSVAPLREGDGDGARRRVTRALTAGAPFALVVMIRAFVFGRVVPLSVLAKPSDLAHGAPYALACWLLAGPMALVAPLALHRASARTKVLAASIVVHFLAVAAAGGDWMPLSRLVAPALPAAVLVAAHLADVASPASSIVRVAIAVAGELFQLSRAGWTDVRAVGERREALIEAARPMLAGAQVIAALDVGWVGASTDATIVDLAGLTDPEIAVLPGGHTSKAISVRLLDARAVDALVLLVREREPLGTPWTDTVFARTVELRLARIPDAAASFSVVGECVAPHLRYVVLRRGR